MISEYFILQTLQVPVYKLYFHTLRCVWISFAHWNIVS